MPPRLFYPSPRDPMNTQAFKQAVAGQTTELRPLRTDGATRIHVARDDRWPPAKTIALAAAVAALVWAVVLIPFVLHAG